MKETATKKLWFRAKRYGYGWYPVTWQGWTVLLIYVVAVFANARAMGSTPSPTSGQLFSFFIRFLVLTIALIIICRMKGEKGKWRWGNDTGSNE